MAARQTLSRGNALPLHVPKIIPSGAGAHPRFCAKLRIPKNFPKILTRIPISNFRRNSRAFRGLCVYEISKTQHCKSVVIGKDEQHEWVAEEVQVMPTTTKAKRKGAQRQS